MSEELIQIRIPSSSDKLRNNFPIDPRGDIEIIIHQKTFKLQKAHLRLESSFFRKMLSQNRSILQINENFDVQLLEYEIELFEKVLLCFYGSALHIPRSKVLSSYPIVEFLEIESLKKQLKEDMVNNTSAYQFFPLFNIAHKFNIEEVFQKCVLELEYHDFMQMKNQTSEMLDVSEELFRLIVKSHNRCEKSKRTLSAYEVNSLIQSFCERKNISEDHKNNLKFELIDKNNLTSIEYQNIFIQTNNLKNLQYQFYKNNSVNFQSLSPIRSEGSLPLLMQTQNFKMTSVQFQKTVELEMDTTFQKKKNKELVMEKEKLKNLIKTLSDSSINQNEMSKNIHEEFKTIKKALSKKENEASSLTTKMKNLDSDLSIMEKSLSDQGERLNKLFKSTKEMMDKYDEQNDRMDQSMESESSSFWGATGSNNDKFSVFDLGNEVPPAKSVSSKAETIKSKQPSRVASLEAKKEVNSPQLENYYKQDNLYFSTKPQIFKSQEEISNFSSILGTERFTTKKLKLLYRASSLSSENYNQNEKACSEIAENLRFKSKNLRNIVFLFRTESEKLVGGFSSVALDLYSENNFADEDAYIFTVTSNRKFKIKKEEQNDAIMMNKGYIICFGMDLMISDKIFEDDNYCDWPSCYQTYPELESKGFRGSDWLVGESQFRIKELECYVVEEEGTDMII